MNIKSLIYNIPAIERDPLVTGLNRSVKSENTSPDRDPNGQRQRENNPEAKEFLNDEEMQLALETLKNFAGVKENRLKVELIIVETARFVMITDIDNKVIRRIPENELWPLIKDKDKNRGNLIDRAG
jgi:uncharacterized FlaG/YvyC family protein